MTRAPRLLALLALAVTPAWAAVADLASLPQHHLAADGVQAAIAEAQGDPLRYAVAQPLQLGLADGHWDEPAAGLARWRLRLASAGARSLSLKLDNLQLPPGASLRLLGETGDDVQGPFGPEQRGTLWLPLVRSDAAVLEVQLPAAERDALALQVSAGFHGFRSFTPGDDYVAKGAFGTADSCNIDFACSEGNNWRDPGRAVVLLTRDGVARCTGTLVNNVRQDNQPLVLTANHCGFRSTNIGSVQAYFNVQKSICGGLANGPINQNLGARRFLARDAESDFTLLELSSVPPSEFNAHYAGWDARSTAPASGAAIHHPQGDDKKIALYDQPAQRVDGQPIQLNATQTFDVNAWRVVWSRGTTEAGSSGSALLNPSRRIVGVLSGGGASCSTPTEPDFFGRLDQAWGAQAEAGGPLKNYLDPDCSGATTLDGRDASTAGTPPAPSSCPVPTQESSGGGGTLSPLALLALALAFALPRLRRRGWSSRR